MDKIQEVTIYTNEESSQISSWSNVPFFFTETLLSKGIRVNRVHLTQSPLLSSFFNGTLRRLLKVINRSNTYNYFRSYLHFITTRSKIKRSQRKYQQSDFNIFLTFSFSSSGLGKKPAIQLCDWTYEYYIRQLENRVPDPLEMQAVKRENRQIEGSDLIFALFPTVASYMRERYPNKKIYYLGNAVNTLYADPDPTLPRQKEKKPNLLFIGSKKYLDGARILIDASRILKRDYANLRLDIIGMERDDFPGLPEEVVCHGYLDKGNEKQRDLYYSLLQNAKVFVNTTPRWSAFSATIEAMYFYTPVIITPYKEFTDTFGSEIDFGFFCESNSPEVLVPLIRNVLDHPAYLQLGKKAHESVKDFTWGNYVNRFLEIVKEELHA